MKPPAPNPCGSCPYREDVPSGIWHKAEYQKLPLYDLQTWEQPPSVFLCHQQDGRVCAGWAGCHDMTQSLGLRLAAIDGTDPEVINDILSYKTTTPLFASGADAMEHGTREISKPGDRAVRIMTGLSRKASRRKGKGKRR